MAVSISPLFVVYSRRLCRILGMIFITQGIFGAVIPTVIIKAAGWRLLRFADRLLGRSTYLEVTPFYGAAECWSELAAFFWLFPFCLSFDSKKKKIARKAENLLSGPVPFLKHGQPLAERLFSDSPSVLALRLSVPVLDKAAGFGKLHNQQRNQNQAQAFQIQTHGKRNKTE